ncbi:MAG: ATP-binding protein [Acidobacteriota bacterium]|nr:ATP-binding protein [Acidobacteriota bacterium]
MSGFRLRTERLKLVAIALLLVLASVLYFVIQRGKVGDLRLATDKTLLVGLAATLVLLTISLLWVLIGHLARTLAQRREGAFGSRLRARVVFAFLALVLAPSLFLFAGAVSIVSRTLRAVATPELEQTLRDAGTVAEAVFGSARRRAAHATGQLARGLAGAETEAIRAKLEAALYGFDLQAVGYVPPEGEPLCLTRLGSSERSAGPDELCHLPAGLMERARREGRMSHAEGSLATFGWRAVALAPLDGARGRGALVWAQIYVPDRLAVRLERLQRTEQRVVDFRRTRPAMQRLYVALFALLALLVVFAGVWTGLHLAREITDPILELARGTEALAGGDLDYRVDEAGDDEIAQLAASFNRMAEEIQRHRWDLQARRRYIEALLEAVPVGVLSLDASGAIRTANRRALEVLRVESLVVGRPLHEVLDRGRAGVAASLEPLVRGERELLAEEVAITVEEGVVSVQLRGQRLPLAEGGEGLLVVLEDLTDLRRAERLAAWGEVARRVAHEIKNPLTPIRLAAERMLRHYRKDPARAGAVVEKGVATIVREVESLKALIDEFSRFSRLPRLRMQPGDLGAVVREGVELYQGPHPGVKILVEVEEKLPPHRLDEQAMRRCLINLIENAIAAVGRQGTVVVRARSVPAHQAVALEVEDDGVGLSEEDRDKLFLPSFTRRPGGTGLGLAIVHRIVSEHGGTIRAESAEPRGTRMVIELPAGPTTERETNHDG